MASMDGTLPEKGLVKGTNWWGAFVIGLAGTILVTGIAPYVVQGTGALGIILIGVMTIAGCFLCFCLAELATMWPDRTGGIPGYATESFRPLVGNTAARHIGGTSGWAYWLGWFPVAPINVILTASYLAVLFNFSPGHLIDPVGTTWGTPIGVNDRPRLLRAPRCLIFIPAYLGIRLGAAFATVLGVLSMLPITVMIFLPFFKPSSIHWGNVAGFHAPPGVHVNLIFIAAWFFPILWNVIAMEAAACYVGECRGGARDAKIALTAEGLFGMFIYIVTPLMFVAVLGLALTSADPLTLYLAYTDKIFGAGSWEKWFVGIPLIAGAGAVRAERDHGRRPLAVPGVRGRPAAALVPCTRTGTACRELRDGVQRGVRGDPCAARLAAADLHHLQRRLPAVLLARPGRLLRLPAPAPDSRGRSGCPRWRKWIALAHLHLLDGHLLLRRLELAEDHPGQPAPGTRALPARPADRGAVRSAVLVAGVAGPQARGGRPSAGPASPGDHRAAPRLPTASRRWTARPAWHPSPRPVRRAIHPPAG